MFGVFEIREQRDFDICTPCALTSSGLDGEVVWGSVVGKCALYMSYPTYERVESDVAPNQSSPFSPQS